MLRRALPSLFCALALVAPAYSQDVFVPRELKAQPVHPPKEHKPEAKPEKSKEDVRRTEPLTESKTAKNETAPIKTDKAAAPKEKVAATKTAPPADDIVTIKVEKQAATKQPPPAKTVAKTEPVKEKKTPAPSKEKADGDLPMIKVEKASVAKEPAAPKTVAKTEPAKEKTEKPTKDEAKVAKSDKAQAKDEPAKKTATKTDNVKVETVTAKADKPVANEKPATVAASSSLKDDKSAKKEPVSVAKTEKTEKAPKEKEKLPVIAAKPPTTKTEALIAKVEPLPPREGPAKSEIVSVPSQKDQSQIMPAVSSSLDTGFTRIADGFDFPVGKPEAEGYYKARGFRPGGHVGEDWDGIRGGDTDLGDPIYCVGNGIVVFARDVHLGWGNVIIVRHAYREGGNVKYIDSLYGHLNTMLVKRGQTVSRGQQIATMGTAHGQYDAHLHFEIRKNLEIGMSRSKFQKDFSNYYSPTQFIDSHRHLSGGGANYKVAMNTFTHDWMFHFDSNRNFGPRKRSISESSAALRRATTSTH